MIRTVACTAIVLGIAFTAAGQDRRALKSFEILPVEEGETAYVIEDGEATINDDLIRRIAVGQERVTATYRNRTDKKKRARYTIELYNQFGLLLGDCDVGRAIFGGSGYISPGDVGSERLHITWFPLDRILMKSAATLPDDWKTVKWVVIKDTNTRDGGS